MEHNEQKRKFVFHTQRHLSFGECVFVCGSHNLLGNWNPIKAIKLKWTSNDNWVLGINIAITSTITIEYKFFISDELLSRPPRWDEGANQLVELTYQNDNEQQHQLSIMSFNIYYDMTSWQDRKQLVLNMITQNRPDFIGLQEVTVNQREFLLQNLIKQYQYFGRSRSAEENQDEEVGILFRKDKFCRIDGGHVWFSREPYKPDYGSFLPRMMTWGLFTCFEHDEMVALFNTHFDHQSEVSRCESMMILIKYIRKVIAQARKLALLVITGDFNVNDNDACLKELEDTKLVANVRKTAKVSEKYETTYHMFQGEKYTGFQQIDHIYVNIGSIYEPTEFKTLKDKGPQGKYPSDHYPILVNLTRRDKKQE